MRRLHMLHSLDIEPGQLGSTVRLGTKWADARPGEGLLLCVCDAHCQGCDVEGPESPCPVCHNAGVGVVTEVWIGTFINIPADYLALEHEERSREYEGLFASMKKAYGDEFEDMKTVTVLVYQRVE